MPLPASAATPIVRCMISQEFDVIVVGAGMAGSTAAAHLAPHKRVALVEAEDAPGYHTTGRSAAIWMLNYGPPEVRVLTGLSRSFLQGPPPGFAEHPLVSHRMVIFLAPEDQRPQLEQMLTEGIGLQPLKVETACAMVPALRPDYAVAAAIEQDGFDLDVAAIQQGFRANSAPPVERWRCAAGPARSSGGPVVGTCTPRPARCSTRRLSSTRRVHGATRSPRSPGFARWA